VFSVVQFAALVYAAVAVIPPPLDAPLAERAAWYAQHGASLAVGSYLLALPVPCFFLFIGGLFVILRRAGGDALAVTAAAAGTAAAMLWPLGALLASLGATIAQHGGDAATVLALDGLAPLTLALGGLPRATFLGAASLALLDGRFVPRWLGWAGLAIGVVNLVGSGLVVTVAVFPALILGLVLFLLWVATLSMVLPRELRREDRLRGRAIPVAA
jgi:uncharacterized ion transporter superfamily protein YfcC